MFSVLLANELKRCNFSDGVDGVLRLLSCVVDAEMTIGDLGRICEISDVELENIAILSFTLFSDFSSLLRQLIGLGRPSVADLNDGGLVSTKFVISSKCCILRGTSGATIAVALLVACDLVKSIAMLALLSLFVEVGIETEPAWNVGERDRRKNIRMLNKVWALNELLAVAGIL